MYSSFKLKWLWINHGSMVSHPWIFYFFHFLSFYLPIFILTLPVPPKILFFFFFTHPRMFLQVTPVDTWISWGLYAIGFSGTVNFTVVYWKLVQWYCKFYTGRFYTGDVGSIQVGSIHVGRCSQWFDILTDRPVILQVCSLPNFLWSIIFTVLICLNDGWFSKFTIILKNQKIRQWRNIFD